MTIRPRYADALANLGIAQTMAGDETVAEASFRRAVQIQPWHHDATIRLATLLGELGRASEARALLEAAIAAAPCAEFHAASGNLLLRTGSPDDAVEQYRLAIKLKPGDAIAHFNMGNACEELHDTDGTASNFARAAELRLDKPLWRLRALVCGPVVFESHGEIEEHCAKVDAAISGEQGAGSTDRRKAGSREQGANRPHPRPLSRRARGVRRSGLLPASDSPLPAPCSPP